MSTARKIKVDFMLKNEGEMPSKDKTILNFQSKNDPEYIESKAKFELKLKHENNLKFQKKKYRCEHYFTVRNHVEMFETGKHFVNQFENGSNFFALFPSTSIESLDSTLLGLSSFFNYHKNMKATLFIDQFDQSYLNKKIKKTSEVVELIGEDVEIEFLTYDGIEIFELEKMKSVLLTYGSDKFQEVINQFKKRNEVSFFQFPKISSIEKNKEFYLPWISYLDSLSVILEVGKSKRSELEKLVNFARSYDLKVNGAIFYKASK